MSTKMSAYDKKSCDKCSSRGDVYDHGYLLCAICYLSKYNPKKADELKRQNRLTR